MAAAAAVRVTHARRTHGAGAATTSPFSPFSSCSDETPCCEKQLESDEARIVRMSSKRIAFVLSLLGGYAQPRRYWHGGTREKQSHVLRSDSGSGPGSDF
eukprot:996359-Prorocentrum_minimum.AAC.2